MVESLVPQKFKTTIEALPVFDNDQFVFSPFDKRIVLFLNDLSRLILKDKLLRANPSFAALGFWLRKSNLNLIIDENRSILDSDKIKIKPIGIVFHLCPSNVDTMFFYSLAIALLAGNKNIVRISSRLEDPMIDKLFLYINELINGNYSDFYYYMTIIKYNHEAEYNNVISLNCDGRIIWGGDETIRQFKNVPTKPKVKDLYFADRVSISILKAEEVLGLDRKNLSTISRKLYNDIFTFDQKGCSSPHSLFLLGNKDQSDKALIVLYSEISKLAALNYDNDINSMASIKFNRLAEDILANNSKPFITKNNYLTISELTSNEIPHTCGLGYIYYKSLSNLIELENFLSDKIQTIGYFGLSAFDIEELQNISIADRIVPIGKALDFDYIWDGYNILLEMLSFKYIMVK